jgi:ABC-type multidrug transport system fused ATPase/permease subunit
VKKGAAAPLPELWKLAGLYVLAILVLQGVRLGGVYLSSSLGWNASNALRIDLTRHVLALDMSFHTAKRPGELIERLDGDVSAIAAMFSQFFFQVAGNGLLLIGILAVLFHQNVWVGAILTGFAAMAFTLLALTRKTAIAPFTAEREARSDLAGFIEERLGGLDDIRANGGGGHVMRRLGELNARLTRMGVRAIRTVALYMALITNSVFILGYGLGLALGVALFLRGEASVGAVYLIVQYTQMIRQPLEVIGMQMQEMQRAMAGLGRVRALQATPVTVTDGPGAGWGSAAPAVAFDRVGFAYDDDVPVLDGVTFRLEPGRTLGLLGRTGAGKTTVTRLLCRLYDPTTGAITLDGRDLRDARLAELHAHVGVVTQDVQLFQASIRDNLTFFDPALPDRRLIEVLDALQLGPWLARQPKGLDTVLEGGATGLSSGEAQLLAFARVFLRDPGLVLLDEASSRLDPATERAIEQALDTLLHAERRRTAIIVAHKLATVRAVDEIMILERGRIVEHGPRAALAADPASRFAGLLKTGLEEAMA